VKNSTSVRSIWQAIRADYGFQSTGAYFLDFANIKVDVDECAEDLFQRLMSFIEDNLLIANSSITHHGVVITADEELSPTLENLVVLTWLRLIHPDLPALWHRVKVKDAGPLETGNFTGVRLPPRRDSLYR